MFCPLALDHGNTADWASVVVAVLVGFSVWRLSVAANRTSEAAHRNEVFLRAEEGRLLSYYLFHEVAAAARNYTAMADQLSSPDFPDRLSASADDRRTYLQMFRRERTPTIEAHFSRLFVLEPRISKHLSMGIGLAAQLRNVAGFVPDAPGTPESERIAIEGMQKVCALAATAFRIAEDGLKQVLSDDASASKP
ncbi:hypothetical protein [Xanthomonas bundabergensis]|uniref:hypothetical protein n=1 Tax=Xanthomonas bundabergensis TaxID=3160842 RepID=UPI003519843A